MIIDTNIIAYDFMTDFNGLSRHYTNPQYSSGIYEADKPKYKIGPPSSEYPNLTLPCNLYDEYGNKIPNGYYMVVLSDDMKFLDLYQSNELKARVKVIKLVEKMYTNEELDEESEIIERLHRAKEKGKIKKIKEVEEELKAFKDKLNANSYAQIFDSMQGYYILKYNKNGKRAEGIIQK